MAKFRTVSSQWARREDFDLDDVALLVDTHKDGIINDGGDDDDALIVIEDGAGTMSHHGGSESLAQLIHVHALLYGFLLALSTVSHSSMISHEQAARHGDINSDKY